MGIVAPVHVEFSWTRDQTMSPAFAGGFLTTGLPGKSQIYDSDGGTQSYSWFCHHVTLSKLLLTTPPPQSRMERMKMYLPALKGSGDEE